MIQFRLFTDVPFKVTLSIGLAMLGALLVVLIGFAFMSYRKNKKHLGNGWFYCLLLLRCLAAILLLLAILNPIIAIAGRHRKGTLIFMVDNSRSMQTKDAVGGLTRLQTARDLLLGRDGLLEQIRGDFEVLTYAFGKGVRRLPPRRTFGKPSRTTDLQEAFTFANSLARTSGASGIIALSDGQNNVHKDGKLLEKKPQSPIFCVGIGRKQTDVTGEPDIELSQVFAKRIMAQHTKYTLDLSVKKTNVGDSEIKLGVTEAGSPVSEQTIDIDSPTGLQHALVEFTPKESGLHRFRLSAATVRGEQVVGNNSRFFTVNVISPGLKILYFEGRPRWEFKFVRRALETSPDVELFSMVRTAPDAFYVQGQTDELPVLTGFPSSFDDLLKFDVVILGSGGREILSPSNLSDMVKFVDNGKGLILLGSADLASLMGSELEAVIPALVGQGRIGTPFHLELTPYGRTHPVMKGLENLFATDNRLSRFKGLVVLERKKQGALSLATAASQDAILAQRYGKGRVLLFAPDSSWEWSLALEGAGYSSVYGRFWEQAVRWASGYQVSDEDEAFPIIVYTDKDYYDLDEPVVVEMQTSVPLSEIALSWGQSDKPDRKLQLTDVAAETRRYFGKLYPEEIGEYQLQVTYKNEERTLWFTIGNPLAESTRTELNESLLKKIALSSGGKYFDITQKKDLLKALHSLAIVRRPTEKEASIWESPYPFILFIALCSLEWFFRRRKQMI